MTSGLSVRRNLRPLLTRPLPTSLFNIVQSSQSGSRQFYSQSVNLLRAAVAHKHPGAVGSSACPEPQRAREAFDPRKHENALGLTLSHPHSSNRLFVGDQIVEIKVLAVPGPNWIVHCTCRLGQPIRPFLSLKVEQLHRCKIG